MEGKQFILFQRMGGQEKDSACADILNRSGKVAGCQRIKLGFHRDFHPQIFLPLKGVLHLDYRALGHPRFRQAICLGIILNN